MCVCTHTSFASVNEDQRRMQMTDHRPVQGCFLKTALFVLIMINFFSLIPNSLHAWERIDFKNAPTQDMFPESDAVVIKNEGYMEIKKMERHCLPNMKSSKFFQTPIRDIAGKACRLITA